MFLFLIHPFEIYSMTFYHQTPNRSNLACTKTRKEVNCVSPWPVTIDWSVEPLCSSTFVGLCQESWICICSSNCWYVFYVIWPHDNVSTERKRENDDAYVFQTMGLRRLRMQSMSFVTHDPILLCVLFKVFVAFCFHQWVLLVLFASTVHIYQQKVKKQHSVPFLSESKHGTTPGSYRFWIWPLPIKAWWTERALSQPSWYNNFVCL